jgi:branched-subunit amino acid ABC-type transport system permease component
MVEALLDGLAAGLAYALLATALVLVRAGWQGLCAPGRRTGTEAALDDLAVPVLALLPALLARRGLQGRLAALPVLADLVWPALPVIMALAVLLWSASRLGRVWRAQAADPAAAAAIGLPVRRAGGRALALGLVVAAGAGMLAQGGPPHILPAPELPALLAMLAAGPTGLLPAALLALAAGLAGGFAVLLPWPDHGATVTFGLLALVLLARLAPREPVRG